MTEKPTKRFPVRADAFLQEVGLCITLWAAVDYELFRIFRACVGSAEKQCAILYYRIAGLEPRFTTTDELVLSILPSREERNGAHDPPEVKRWKAAIDGYSSLLSTRRMIAHQPLQLKLPGGGLIQYVNHLNIFSTTPVTDAEYIINAGEAEGRRQRKSSSPKQLTMHELQKHAHDVRGLRGRLEKFYTEVLLLLVHTEGPRGPVLRL